MQQDGWPKHGGSRKHFSPKKEKENNLLEVGLGVFKTSDASPIVREVCVISMPKVRKMEYG